MKTSEINIEKVTAKTVGRKLHTYDTWNGSSMTITVEAAELQTNSVLFTGTNSWGGKSGIYVNKEFVKSLIKTGEAVRHNEVDHCDVRTTWSLK
jgi:hypothetical protein